MDCFYIPFVWYCDNVWILAHTVEDFADIVGMIQVALAPSGLTLPDDRVEVTMNQDVQGDGTSALAKFIQKSANFAFKVLKSFAPLITYFFDTL